MRHHLQRAIILAAGLGTRLRPITLTTPKPLVQVGGKCLLDWALEQVAAAGITEAVVNTSYLYEQIEAHVAARAAMLPRVHLSRETPQPLETGGGIAKALPVLGDAPFIVLNSDTICLDGEGESAIARLWNAWEKREDIDFLMLMHPREKSIGFYGAGDFIVRADGAVRRPRADEDAPYVFTGIEIIHPRVFKGCPSEPFSLNILWDRSKSHDSWYTRIAAIVHEGDWLHVGDAEGLRAVESYFKAKR